MKKRTVRKWMNLSGRGKAPKKVQIFLNSNGKFPEGQIPIREQII